MTNDKLYVIDEIVKANVHLLSNSKVNKAGYIFREATDEDVQARGWVKRR